MLLFQEQGEMAKFFLVSLCCEVVRMGVQKQLENCKYSLELV